MDAPALYAALYLGAGVITLAVVIAANWPPRRRDPESLTSILEKMQPGTESLWYRFRAKLLAPVLACMAMVLLWPLVPLMKLQEWWNQRRNARRSDRDQFRIERKHLVEQLTLEEVEQREVVSDPLGAVPSLPFGHLHPIWAQIRADLKPRDQLWSFSGVWPGRSFNDESREGYVVRRWGRSRQRIVTVCRQVEEPKVIPRKSHRATTSDEIEIPAFLRKHAD
jgi:hypothetical protein